MTMQDLRGRIVQKYGTNGEFAKHLGTSQQTVSAKLNGRSQFSQKDIVTWSNALEIDADSIGRYFFGNKL